MRGGGVGYTRERGKYTGVSDSLDQHTPILAIHGEGYFRAHIYTAAWWDGGLSVS